jgi:23S rRNA pseudouridine2604 synthase
MSNGIPILNTVTKKCKVERVNDYVFKIILTQGLNRQIRRMCTYLDYEVKKLQRIRIMNVSLDNLAIGAWRNMTEKELEFILQAVTHSVKTEEASYTISEEDDFE